MKKNSKQTSAKPKPAVETEEPQTIFVREIVEAMRDDRIAHDIWTTVESTTPVYTVCEVGDFAQMIDCHLATMLDFAEESTNGEIEHDKPLEVIALMIKGIRAITEEPIDSMCDRENRTLKFRMAFEREQKERTLGTFQKALLGYRPGETLGTFLDERQARLRSEFEAKAATE